MRKFYRLNEAAEQLGISEDDIKLLVRDGGLNEFCNGGYTTFRVEEIKELIPKRITNGRDHHQKEENGLVINKKAKRLTYRTNAERGAGVVVDIGVDNEDNLSPIKIVIKCCPQLSLISRIKDAILTMLGYDTVYNINVSAETVLAVQKELQNAGQDN